MLRQSFGAAGDDLLRGVTQVLARAYRDISQTALRQASAKLAHAVFSPHQDKHPAVAAHIRAEVAASSVEADRDHILIRSPQLGAQVHQRADPRHNRHITVAQQRQQLFCAAEKAHVPGHGHREAAVLPVSADKGRDGLRGDGLRHRLARARGAFQHPLRAQHALRPAQRRFRRLRHRRPVSGADAHDGDLGLPAQAEPLAQQLHRLGKVKSLPLGRPADHHQLCPRLPGGGDFFLKAPGCAGLLGNQVGRPHGAEHGGVHFLGKWALHGENMGRLHPRLPAKPQRVLHGQHPGEHPSGKVRHRREFRQFLASGGQQDISLHRVQIGHRRWDIRNAYRVLRRVPAPA